jgi:hypothetical protein
VHGAIVRLYLPRYERALPLIEQALRDAAVDTGLPEGYLLQSSLAGVLGHASLARYPRRL